MLLDALIRYHDEIMDKYGDPRTKDYPLMSGPFPTIIICLTYVIVVKYVGPKLMENRPRYELKTVLLIYNLAQVISSGYTVFQCIRVGLLTSISWTCYPVDYSDNENTKIMVFMSWYIFMSKFFEMLDTVLFIMRKKMNQVSTLHVFHHAIMPFSVWWGAKFFPGGHASYWAFWNSSVHVIMYSYYLLAGMGPKIQKYLWWKKYLTILQLVQFVAIWIHATQVLFNGCNYNKVYSVYVSSLGIVFFYMFFQYYKDEYNKGGKSRTEAFPKAMNMCSPSASSGGKFYDSNQTNNNRNKKAD